MADFKNTQGTVKTEQIVIERFIKLAYFDKYTEVNSSELKLWKAYKWRDAFNNYKEYNINDLLANGYVIKSLTKSFTTVDEDGRFGVETAILERETK